MCEIGYYIASENESGGYNMAVSGTVGIFGTMSKIVDHSMLLCVRLSNLPLNLNSSVTLFYYVGQDP